MVHREKDKIARGLENTAGASPKMTSPAYNIPENSILTLGRTELPSL